jgi:hypothetical protein
MKAGAILMFLFKPFVPLVVLIMFRILNEEQELSWDLTGYQK